jgi:putative ABC transport system permease protein
VSEPGGLMRPGGAWRLGSTGRLVTMLAAADIRRRPAQAALLFIALAAAATTLTMALALAATSNSPWDRTQAATLGPDVVGSTALYADPRGHPQQAGRAALTGLTRAAGVVAAAGPFQTDMLPGGLSVRGIKVTVEVEGRPAAPTAVDRPAVTAGRWVRPGGVVVEQSFAQALGVRPGDRITLSGRPFTVAGLAVSTVRAPYPQFMIGQAWVTEADAARLAAAGAGVADVIDLRLANRAAAAPFARRYCAGPAFTCRTWQQNRNTATGMGTTHAALLTGAWGLGMLSAACVTVLVGGRLAAQGRRAGLLKAVGATPRLVTAVLLAEHVVIAVLAAAAGLLLGWRIAPLLTSVGAGLLGAVAAPPVTLGTGTAVVAFTVAVAGSATVPPAIRGARRSTLRALTITTRPPRRAAWLLRLSAHLPVALLLGVRMASRRPGRTVLTAASLTVTTAMVVAALALQLNLDVSAGQARQLGTLVPGATNPADAQLGDVGFVLAVVLVVLAAVNTIMISWAASLDTRRITALARALGASSRQVAAGLAAAQGIPALVAAIAGVPAGIGVYRLAASAAGVTAAQVLPSPLVLVAVAACVLVGVGLLAAGPARLAARRPVAEALRAE